MNKKLKAKWLKALRSEKYKKGRGQLRSKENRFCCLGVLADVAGCHWLTSDSDGTLDGYGVRSKLGVEQTELPIGLRMRARIYDEQEAQLIKLNDCGPDFDIPWSFKKIAHWIEKNL